MSVSTNKRGFLCPKCGVTRNIPENIAWVTCSCGWTNRPTREQIRQYTIEAETFASCKHRGFELGVIDCGCSGPKTVYKCGLHGLCSARKYNGGSEQKVIWKNGTKSTETLRFCNACDDFAEKFERGSVGFVWPYFGRIGGVLTWHQMLVPHVDCNGVVSLADEKEVVSFDCDFGKGVHEARQLSSWCDTLVVGAYPYIRQLFAHNDRPRRIIYVDHGDGKIDHFWELASQALPDVDTVVCVNQQVAERYAKHHRDVRWIQNAIHEDRVAKTRNVEPKTVLWAHRMTDEKRPLLAAEIARRMPDWRFSFAGSGSMKDQLLEALPPNATYLGDVLNPKDLLSTHAVFLSTTNSEGFGYSIGEAALSGCPVVSSPTGIAPDVATKLVDSEDPEDWERAIREATDGTVGQLRCRELYSQDKFIQAWRDLLAE